MLRVELTALMERSWRIPGDLQASRDETRRGGVTGDIEDRETGREKFSTDLD